MRCASAHPSRSRHKRPGSPATFHPPLLLESALVSREPGKKSPPRSAPARNCSRSVVAGALDQSGGPARNLFPPWSIRSAACLAAEAPRAPSLPAHSAKSPAGSPPPPSGQRLPPARPQPPQQQEHEIEKHLHQLKNF